ARLAQALVEGGHALRERSGRHSAQEADHRRGRWLRARPGGRPGESRAAHKGAEIPAPHAVSSKRPHHPEVSPGKHASVAKSQSRSARTWPPFWCRTTATTFPPAPRSKSS